MTKKTKRTERERFNYGICLNDECEMCKNKTVQQIPLRKDFVCQNCGKELRECPPPKPNKKTWLYILAALILIGAIIGCIIAFSGSDAPAGADSQNEVSDTTVAGPIVSVEDSIVTNITSDTIIVHDTIVQNNTTTISEKITTTTVENTVKPAQSNNKGSLNLSYGTYKGETKNGYPHGQGRLTYTTSRQINKNDIKGRVAKEGDYVVGEFFNGFVVYGKHYDSEGNLLGSLNFGVGQENSYDSK